MLNRASVDRIPSMQPFHPQNSLPWASRYLKTTWEAFSFCAQPFCIDKISTRGMLPSGRTSS